MRAFAYLANRSFARGWLKPHKKLVKEAVDVGMKAIMAAGGIGAVQAGAAPHP